MIVKILTEHHLAFLSLQGGCTGLSESTLVKMPHCWESHVTAHFIFLKRLSFGSKECTMELKVQCKQFFWARLASFVSFRTQQWPS